MSNLDFTTEDIKAAHDSVAQQLKINKRRVAEIKATFARNTAEEIELIETQASVCTVGKHTVDSDVLNSIPEKVSVPALKDIMNDQFYNEQVMKAVGCTVYANFFGAVPDQNNLAHIFTVKNAVTNLHRFGDVSVSGYALTGELQNTKDLYVIKTPRKSGATEDLQHELFVGLMGTNLLRKYVPNFAYVYGGFRCAAPIVDKSGVVTSWCDPHSSNVVPYILYEKIAPSQSFGEYVGKCSVKDFHSNFVQFMLSSDIANNLIGWTHYDAHSGNYLIRKVNVKGIGKVFSIPYPTRDGKTLYVASKNVVTAIDYGQATIDYQERHHGPPHLFLRTFGVRDGKFPLHDAYKLMMFLARDALYAENLPVFREIAKLFRFFNESESLERAVELQSPERDIYYALPAHPDLYNKKMFDLFNYARDVWDLSGVVSETPQHDVLHCTSCYSFRGVLKETGAFVEKPVADDFYQFYDLAIYLNNHSVDDYDDLVSRFDYKKAKKSFLADFEESYRQLLALTNIGYSKKYTIGMLPNNASLKEISTIYSNVFESVHLFEKLDAMCKIGISMARLFQDSELNTKCLNRRKEIEALEGSIRSSINYLNSIYEIIYDLLSTSEWKTKYSKPFAWYFASAADAVGLKARFSQDVSRLFTEIRLPATIVKHLETANVKPVKKVEKPVAKIVKKKEVPEQKVIVEEVRDAPKGTDIVIVKPKGLYPINQKVKPIINYKGNVESVQLL